MLRRLAHLGVGDFVPSESLVVVVEPTSFSSFWVDVIVWEAVVAFHTAVSISVVCVRVAERLIVVEWDYTIDRDFFLTVLAGNWFWKVLRMLHEFRNIVV